MYLFILLKIIHEREKIISEIEAMANELKSGGRVEQWLLNSDPHIRRVSQHVNGPLMMALAKTANYHDASCVDVFRDGGVIVGDLPVSKYHK
jgi:hypothetical protein